jgi:hypothetical protein
MATTVNGRITFRILTHIFSRISRVGRHKQHTPAAYLFLASFTTVYEQSLLHFHPISHNSEVISDKNEKI